MVDIGALGQGIGICGNRTRAMVEELKYAQIKAYETELVDTDVVEEDDTDDDEDDDIDVAEDDEEDTEEMAWQN